MNGEDTPIPVILDRVAGNEVHHYHHNDDSGPRVNAKVERNSKGYNWEATVTGATSVKQAITMLKDTEFALRNTWSDEALNRAALTEQAKAAEEFERQKQEALASFTGDPHDHNPT